MKIDLNEIYAGLKAWRHERGITAESQKEGYLVNVMREFGKLSQALKDYEKIKNGERVLRAGIFDIKSTLGEMTIFEGTTKGELEISLEKVEHEIINALCNISVFTINAGTDIPSPVKRTEIEFKKSSLDTDYILKQLVERCAGFSYFDSWGEASAFNIILANCAYLCEQYGYNFQSAMNENIKEISSRTGAYDEKARKCVKADYEKARIEKMIYFDSDTEKIELAKHIASIETENRMLKEQLATRNETSRNETMIKFFENGNKEHIKRVLEKVYKCQDVEHMSDNELVFCYIAKTLKSLDNFCEIAESAETESFSRILKIEKALKHASSFDEFKSFCLEDYNETTRHIPKDSVTVEDNTPKEEPITADGLAEFNLETYKEEVETAVNRARTTIDKFDS